MTDAEMREAVEEKIEATLANSGVDFWRECDVVPDIYDAIAPLCAAEVAAREQAAWRAGRDAAVSAIRDAGFGGAAMDAAIRALQPPADLAAAAATCDAVAVKALEAIVGMIDGCADVPRAPDSLPQMIAHTAREAIRARGRASA